MAENLPAALLSHLPPHRSPSLIFAVSIVQHTLDHKAFPPLSVQNPPDNAPVTESSCPGSCRWRDLCFLLLGNIWLRPQTLAHSSHCSLGRISHPLHTPQHWYTEGFNVGLKFTTLYLACIWLTYDTLDFYFFSWSTKVSLFCLRWHVSQAFKSRLCIFSKTSPTWWKDPPASAPLSPTAEAIPCASNRSSTSFWP